MNMENYQLIKDPIMGDINIYARRLSDNALVHRELNQAYLAWLELGNQPEPADNPPTE
jgi:hypothetical protein